MGVGVAIVSKRVRHELKVRPLEVFETKLVTPRIKRITLTGDLDGFFSPGPADHVKVFFPSADGQIAAPTVTETGIKRPETGEVIARDYTPVANWEESGQQFVDLDFVLHGDGGPASAWASAAQPGDPLVIAGPRGSALPPTGVTDLVIVADETGLPAAQRWAQAFPSIPVIGLFVVQDQEAEQYFAQSTALFNRTQWFVGERGYENAEQALREHSFTAGTLIFLAGEAGGIVPLRRYLRRQVGLDKQQVDAHGYWKQGVQNLDHHAPLDPGSPEDSTE